MSIIEFRDFSFKYEALKEPSLKNINLQIEKGEKVLIIGPSGSSKSTLGMCLNGLIPNAIKGKITGELKIYNKDALKLNINNFSKYVGTLLQDSDNQFIGLNVAEDIAFALENQKIPSNEMSKIVNEVSDRIFIKELLDKSPYDLSGGQKQRVCLGGVLVDDVEILIFDEPLASLDPKTRRETIEIIDKLHKDTKKTILIIEHNLEDALHKSVDRVILMNKGEIIANTSPDNLLKSDLLKNFGIREPLYLSVLKAASCNIEHTTPIYNLEKCSIKEHKIKVKSWFEKNYSLNQEIKNSKNKIIEVQNLNYSYDNVKKALDNVSFNISGGDFVSIIGKNGSGKSTLTKIIMGLIKPDSGSIRFEGIDILEEDIFTRSKKIGIVTQNPNHMISHHMIFDEIAFGLRNLGLEENLIEKKVTETLKFCGLEKYKNWPIEALSFGQKKRVSIASVLVLEPKVLILDEPTAGQDYAHYTSILQFIKELNNKLKITVLIISHDMHLILEYTNHSIVFCDGKIIGNAKMTNVFTQPELLEKANLTTTSIYEIAKILNINSIEDFMQTFISYEQKHILN